MMPTLSGLGGTETPDQPYLLTEAHLDESLLGRADIEPVEAGST